MRRLMVLIVMGCWALFAAAQTAAPLELVVLGSGGPGATGRAGSGYAVLVDGTPRVLVDAGPGTFARLGEAKLVLTRLDVVLLTHLHVDHAGELPGLFKARAVSSRGPIRFDVFGPEGSTGTKPGDASFPATSRFVELLFGKDGAFAYLRDFSAPLTIVATDLRTAVAPAPSPATIFTDGELVVTAIAGHHRDAPAVIYRIDHRGSGKSITFSGDIDAQGLADLRRIAADTSLLVFNSVVLDPPDSPAVLYTLHTPPMGIGAVAADSHAGKLLLSHLSPTIDKAADAVTTSIAQRFKGPVVFATDGMRLAP